MNELLEEYLFSRRVLVSGGRAGENAFETVFALANLFAIRVSDGAPYADPSMIRLASRVLGRDVPAAFYRGFPASVKRLSPDKLLFDQMVHYAVTYGFGRFDRAGHSLLEEEFDRLAFRENAEPRDFRIVSEKEAEELLREGLRDLLASTRRPDPRGIDLILALLASFPEELPPVASRDTAAILLVRTRDSRFLDFLDLPDVTRLLRELWFADYGGREDLENLTLKNRDRKWIAGLLDRLFEREAPDEASCFEKKKLWKGFLHSIHYAPKNARAASFLARIRGGKNESVSSRFERALSSSGAPAAAALLRDEKGGAALLRRLDHLLSRCRNGEEVARVLSRAGTENPRVLLSLLFHYGDPAEKERFFVFTRLGTLRVHTETARESARRLSRLSPETRAAASAFIRSELERTLHGRLGKVWVDPAMKKIALPFFQGAQTPGFGTLTPGSRIALPPGKKLRAFLYWEKVDDIDLSVIGLNGNWKEREFSWRTMAGNQSEAILYSGDQTAGFHGGSEFFDVSLDLFSAMYPGIRYLVFCANVYSDAAFSSCVARAGYMMRDEEDSGGIFEAKTVSSAFKIDAPSTFAYLYALDLSAREIVWLNLSRSGSTHVAGETGFAFLDRAFRSTGVMNVYDLVTLMASEAADSPEKADLIVGDGDYSALGKEQIRSVDAEKIAALPDRR